MYLQNLRKDSVYPLLLFFLLLGFHTQAQKTKAQLEREKQENLRKIREAANILKETQAQKTTSLAQLSVLQKEIIARNELITAISQEIDLLNREVSEKSDIITALEHDVEKLKEDYARMIYDAAKTQSHYDRLTFIFSARTFNQLAMRLKYLRQFSDARKYQVEQIEKVKITIAGEKQKVAAIVQEKNELLKTKRIEQENLNLLKSKQDELVAALNNKEQQLKKEVAEREKDNKRLEKLVEDIVKKEIARARKEAEARAKAEKAAGKAPSGTSATPDAAKLASKFEMNLRKLPWPVARGEIVGHFGIQPHPVLKGVTIENLGVDILTMKEETVRAVFQGEVLTIASVPGMHNVVMIRHENYITVYARLKSVSVKRGQTVQAKDPIGIVQTDKDGQSQLQFQIWKDDKKLDPELWLIKK